MQQIDEYSYKCGVIDCFNEMLKVGLKKLALGHTCNSSQQRNEYISFSEEICLKYSTQFYVEDDILVTDLFPISSCKGKYNIFYYKDIQILNQYLSLKKRKQQLLSSSLYTGQDRFQLAYDFGIILSYAPESINELISSNQEKE